MLARELKQAVRSAYQLAANQHHEYVTVNHLLLSLLEHTSVKELAMTCGADLPLFQKKIQLFMNRTLAKISKQSESISIIPTVSFNRVLQSAYTEVRAVHRNLVMGVDVFSALFGEYDCECIQLLVDSGLDRFEALHLIDRYFYSCAA